MVRNYTTDDLEAVISVFQRSVREVASQDYSPAQVAAWAPEPPDSDTWSARLGSGGVFVCECHDEIVGFARVEHGGYIDLLYVHPEFQGRGIGRALFQRLVAWVSTRGLRRLVAEVSVTARPFFERAGFRLIGQQEVKRRGVRLQNFRMEADIV